VKLRPSYDPKERTSVAVDVFDGPAHPDEFCWDDPDKIKEATGVDDENDLESLLLLRNLKLETRQHEDSRNHPPEEMRKKDHLETGEEREQAVGSDTHAPPTSLCDATGGEPFLAHRLEVDYEPEEDIESEDLSYERQLYREYQLREEEDRRVGQDTAVSRETVEAPREGRSSSHSDASEGGDQQEQYEHPEDDVRAWLKFRKRIERSPSQCVRYCLGDKPLWISSQLPSLADIPECALCGAARVPELQLMPPLLLCLSRRDSALVAMDWGTVTVYSCPYSCGEVDQTVQEVVYVQGPI